MTDEIKDGGPAFPGPDAKVLLPDHLEEEAQTITFMQNGMSLRDWYAGMALQGACANNFTHELNEELARHAYEIADAMLEARTK